MKHVLVGVCIALLAFGLAACSGSSTATPVANPPSTPIQPSSQADQSNMVTTASGLKYVDLIVGAGAMPNKTDWVTVNYTGTLEDGTVFDASAQHGGPATFPLDQVIPGWSEGVGTMKIGGTRKLVIPPELAYGAQGAGNGAIPPNATLTFVVDLLAAKPAPQAKIEDTQVGAGAEAKNGDTVSVNYTGKLEDGTVFDSSVGKQPLDFVLGTHQVIPGMEQGVLGMKVGGKRTITIPPELAYGAQGAGNGVIPPNATLIFDVELVAIK